MPPFPQPMGDFLYDCVSQFSLLRCFSLNSCVGPCTVSQSVRREHLVVLDGCLFERS